MTAVAELVASAPPAEPRRPRVLLVGSALGSAAFAVAILGLVGAYTRARADVLAAGDEWLPDGTVIPLTSPNMGFVTLLMSAVTMQWAVYALRNHDRTHASLALGLTALFGVAFINSTAYLYSEMGFAIAETPQAVLVYAITGLHLAMVVVGLVFAAAMAFQALGGQLTGRSAEGMAAAALFWYVTIGIYSVVWYAIYITK
jgi:heme/copper-type cytochrome/quinol oxidase subunit 3